MRKKSLSGRVADSSAGATLEPWRAARVRRGAVVLALALLLGLYASAVARTAWLSDDAYISFRVADNVVEGYGLRWNVTERVQVFTHPLWVLLLSGLRAATGELYLTSIAASMALSAAAVLLLTLGVARDPVAAGVGLVLVTLSRSFVDFSTSGLESPLVHFLLAVLFVLYLRERRVEWLVLVGGLVFITRYDLALIVVPAIAWAFVMQSDGKSRSRAERPAVPALLASLAPVALWMSFSLLYYGTIWPNTAYAKLGTGISRSFLLEQGVLYLRDSLSRDPSTLLTVIAAVAVGAWSRELRGFALGILLYLVYILWIGGDFMSGRFLSAPFFIAVCSIVFALRRVPSYGRLAVLGLALAAGLPSLRYTVLSGNDYDAPGWSARGIADERGVYYRHTGLLRRRHAFEPPRVRLPDRVQRALDDGERVVLGDAVGLIGHAVGPRLHIIDLLGLGDPLLSRLPAQPFTRPGHHYRELPEGYVESVATGQNHIADPGLARFYAEVELITREPILANRRLLAILWMNLGAHDSLLKHFASTRARPKDRS